MISNLIARFKNILIVAGAVLLWSVVLWTYRGCQVEDEVNDKWQMKIATAVPETTQTVRVDTVRLPSVSSGLKPITIYIENSVDELLQLERDSLRKFLDRLIQPKVMWFKSPEIGQLIATYYPLRDTVDYDHHPPPRLEKVITNDIRLPVLVERPWWELPAYIGGTAVATWIVAQTVR
jgi:hypothetical protein